jgi:hypothetical protein
MLENDDQTRALRSSRADVPDEWRRAYGRDNEFMVADVPGTGMTVGLSREMFAACAAYADQTRDIDLVAEGRLPVTAPDLDSESPEWEERRERKREVQSEIRDERKELMKRVVVASFEQARGASWEQLAQRRLRYTDDVTAPEAASSVAYLAARAPF